MMFRTTLGVMLASMFFPPFAPAQEKSVNPGINKSFEKPSPEEYVKKFEVESREVAANAKQIVDACKLKPGMAVADVGSGTGLFTRKFAAEVGKDGKVYAVDIAPAFLKHVAKTSDEAGLKNVHTIQCDQFSTKLPKNSVDLVFVCDTYHHFEFPQRTLQSIHEALKPKGTFIVIDFQRIEGKSTDFIMKHVRAGKETFVKEILAAGFKVASEEQFLKENYFIRFEKIERAEEKGGRSAKRFQDKLDKSFTPDKARAIFGAPDRQPGSGLVIFEYDLDDGRCVRLGFPGFQAVTYAHIIESNGATSPIPLR
ncbi:MAG: methyltransferase domain-containing protein [Gemmataceae bacterium]